MPGEDPEGKNKMTDKIEILNGVVILDEIGIEEIDQAIARGIVPVTNRPFTQTLIG